MSKISTYEVVPIPKLADKLIGTSVGGEIEDVTYNFTLQELLDLFIPNIPANTLQGILDYGNTATQDINLFGTITTTNLDVTDTANLFNTYLNEEVHIVGKLFDSADSFGTPGQFLISTGAGVSWYTMPVSIPTLQEVLTEGDTADIDIILDANIEALDISVDTAHVADNLYVLGKLTDGFSSFGTNGQVLSSTSTGVKWVDLPTYSALSPLLFNPISGVFSIQQANGVQSGYLSYADWINFDGKQNAGNYITALTGEAVAFGPGSVPITLNNAAVISKVLSGLNIVGGSIVATDSILTAFGKVQNQINGLLGGVVYQGTWNATSNTPTLVSSIGVQGHYYVVSVAGSTNLNGVTDWQVGDWAIFNGGTWQKVDNTDAVISVNGFTGIVNLITDDIYEGLTNLYFTNTRARNALSASSPLIYDNFTGTFTIQQANGSQNGYLSSTDWTAFNSKQNALSGTGLVKSTGGTISYITDSSSNWNTAYNDSIISAAVTGTTTKTLTLNQQDGGTVTASWTESATGLTSVGLSMPSAFTVSNSPLTSNGTIAVVGAGVASQYVRGDGTLANFPTNGGGGASVAYYLNGGTNQGVFAGDTYYEMSKTAVVGTNTDFNISTDGYVTQFITDAGDPGLLNIPGGNWTFELFFSASSSGGTPAFYVELYKYDGVVFTLIASNSSNPEDITGGTDIDLYITALAVPQTTLTVTDRLAVRVYVITSGRTITLHTQGTHLCEVITTFSTGILALNGLTQQVQYFATGSLGTDFNISSSADTHTFNIPTASVTNRGLLSSTDWSTFNGKQDALTLTTTGTSGAATLIGSTLNIPQYSGTNIYNSDGTLTGARVLTLGGNPLDIAGTTTTRFFANGRVGVGTTTDNGFQFDVNGTARIQGALTIATSTVNNLIFSQGGTTAGPYMRWIYNPDTTGSDKTFLFQYKTGLLNGSIYIAPNSQVSNITYAPTGNNNYVFGGGGSLTTASSNTFIGYNAGGAVTTGGSNIFIGASSGVGIVGGTGNIHIAPNIQTTNGDISNSIHLGSGTALTRSFTIGVGGSAADYLTNIYIGSGYSIPNQLGGSDRRVTIQPTTESGKTDAAALHLQLAGARGTGTGTAGDVIFSTASTTTAGTTLQTLTERMRVFGTTGNVLIRNGGTFTDAGFRLDVQGTGRFTGNLISGSGTYFNSSNQAIASISSTAAAYIEISSVSTSNSSLCFTKAGALSTMWQFYTDSSNNLSIFRNGVNRQIFQVFESTKNVGIDEVSGSSTFSDIASAKLFVNSTAKGFLPPRMTAAQRTAIGTPAVGLVVYQTDGTEGLYENTSTGWRLINAAGGGGSGTVTLVSVVTANGFAGTVATDTTTPAITISTTITGLLKGNGTAISAAVAGTDYLTPSDVAYTVASVSSTYSETATAGTKIINADTTGGAFTVTLPTAVGNKATIVVKKVAGTPNLTIDGAGSETIDGGLTATLIVVNASITLVSDNSNWQII